MRRWALLATVLMASTSIGCAAAARPASAPEPMMVAPPAPPAAAVEVAPAAAPVMAPGAGAAFSADAPAASFSDAKVALQRSSSDLAAARGNCPSACRALGSMDRATGRLCGLAVSSADQRTCADAKTKVISARTNVRAACTLCSGGVVVDPDAPCPSP